MIDRIITALTCCIVLCLMLVAISQQAKTEESISKSSSSSFYSNSYRYILNKTQCNGETRINKVNSYIEKLGGFGKNGRKFPENPRQLRSFCSETRKMLQYIDAFLQECYEEDVRKMANIVIYSLKRHIRVFCTKKQNRKLKKILTYTPCVNQYIEADHCIMGMMNQTSYLIMSNISGKNKIKYVCCFYAEFSRCGAEWLEAIPCMTDEGRVILLEFFRGLSNDILSVACNDYDEQSDRCEKLPPLSTVGQYPKKYQSYLIIMIDLLESMDSLIVDL